MLPDKKSLYHSEIVSAGTFEATVKSDVLESKKKKGSYYVILEVEGEDKFLNLENNACRAAFRGRKGATVAITAHGSREEAYVELDGENGAEEPQPQRPPQQRQQHPPTMHKPQAAGDSYHRMRHNVAAAALVMEQCLKGAAMAWRNAGGEGNDEQVRQVGITLFIQTMNTVDLSQLPATAPAAPKPQPKVQAPEPEAGDDQPEDDIPF